MDNYLAASFPESFTILGRRLLPYSIGRALLLQRLDCEPVITVEQLIRAIIICSVPVADVEKTLRGRWLKFELRWWAFRLGKFDPAEKIALFHEYLAEAISRRPIPLEEDESGTTDSPWLEHLTVTLAAKLHYPRAEILEMPYSLALWDYYTFWENEGRVSLLGERRQAMHDLANAMHDQTLAAINQSPCPT